LKGTRSLNGANREQKRSKIRGEKRARRGITRKKLKVGGKKET